jgi:hypothetical protein
MMKGTVLFIFLFACSALAMAQGDSLQVWNKWCSRKDSMVLFSTANNEIEVYGRGIHPADIKLKSLDYTLRIGPPEVKGDTLSVMAMPHAPNGKKMRLVIIDRKSNKTLKTITFYSNDVPAPTTKVGNLPGPEALRKEILAQTGLKVFFPNSLYSYPYRIKQYTFTIHTPQGSVTAPVTGALLTKEVLQQIKDAPSGTIATFTNIIATCPECATRTLEDIDLKIR